jgi:hypothetical protein
MGPGSRSLRSLVRDDVGRFNFKQPGQLQDTSPRSRRAMRPSCARNLRLIKQRPLRPQSRVQCVGSTRGSHHGHTGITRHSLRNGFNGFLRALPGDRAFLSPSPADGLASLTPASGRQDHTTSPSASAPFVFGATRVHRTPPPTSVTIAKRPSVRDGMISLYSCFYQTGKRKIFADGTGHGIAKTARRANQLPPFTSPRLRGEVGLHAMQSG